MLFEELTCQNYGVERIELPLALTFQAAFEPLFAVRGLLAEKHGEHAHRAGMMGTYAFSMREPMAYTGA